jgi:hypothetical protein
LDGGTINTVRFGLCTLSYTYRIIIDRCEGTIMKFMKRLTGSWLAMMMASLASAGEVMTDRCSAEVAIVSFYGAGPV